MSIRLLGVLAAGLTLHVPPMGLAAVATAPATQPAPPPLPAGLAPAVEPFPGLGYVDWTHGQVWAVGQSEVKTPDNPDHLQWARRLARAQAYRNAVALLAQLRVDADQTLQALADQRRDIDLKGFVSRFEAADETVKVGGRHYVQTTLRLPFYGVQGLSVYLYDHLRHTRQPVPLRPEPRKPMPTDLPAHLLPPIIIIDTSGLGARACLYPKIQDNLGRVLLDWSRRDQAVRLHEGMVTYVAPAPAAASQPQRRQITLKARAVAGVSRTDLVLDAEAASAILADSALEHVLVSGEVYIVIDPANPPR